MFGTNKMEFTNSSTGIAAVKAMQSPARRSNFMMMMSGFGSWLEDEPNRLMLHAKCEALLYLKMGIVLSIRNSKAKQLSLTRKAKNDKSKQQKQLQGKYYPLSKIINAD